MRLKKSPSAPLMFAVVITGCGGASADTYDQVASGLSALMTDERAGEPQTFADLIVAARGEVPAGMAAGGGKLTGARDGLTLEYQVACTSDAGAAMACDANEPAEVKLDWKGKVEDARYKLELERKGDWKVTALDEARARIEGSTTLRVKSDFKDRIEDVRHKYDFDATSRYDVVVQRSDGSIVSGTVHKDVHAKQHADDGSEKLKTDLKLKMTVAFESAEQAELDLDGSYKYRLKVKTGELDEASE